MYCTLEWIHGINKSHYKWSKGSCWASVGSWGWHKHSG